MKAILIRDVKDLGKAGDVVSVADGYGRNFLIPRRLAVEATSGGMKVLERQHAMEAKRGVKLIEDAEALGARLQDLTVTIIGKTGQGTRLYGSVTAQDVADALKEQHHIDIDKRKIDVIQPIKSLGSYVVPIRLQRTITAELRVEVQSESGTAVAEVAPVVEEPVVEADVEPEAIVEPETEVVEEPAVEEIVEPALEEEPTEESETTDQPEG